MLYPSPRRLLVAAGAVCLCAGALLGCDTGITGSDGRIYAGGRHFGNAIGLDGDLAVVGAVDSGEAFVLRRTTGAWVRTSALRRLGKTPDVDLFGWGLSLSGSTLAVGAPIMSLPEIATVPGRVYVYRVSGEAPVLEAELFPPEPMTNRTFGVRVSASGDRVAATVGGATGEFGQVVSPNAVLLYTRGSDGWTEEARIDDPAHDPASGGTSNGFGGGLALDGNRMAIGSGGEAAGGLRTVGRVRVYERSGAIWQLAAEIEPPQITENLRFGGGLALDGPLLAVASRTREVAGELGAGAVFVYRHTGAAWVFEAELRPPDLGFLDSYGFALDADGDRVVVSAAGRARTRGSAFVWVRRPTGAWELEAELFPEGRGSGTAFGEDVALDGDRLLVGAIGVAGFRGAVYEFRRQGSAWAQVR
ncbi:MAG: hypothetical protein ACK41D_01305 [Rubricoccaceae bacterium]